MSPSGGASGRWYYCDCALSAVPTTSSLHHPRSWPTGSWLLAIFAVLNLLLQLPHVLLGTYPVALTSVLTDPLRLYYLFSLDLFGLFVVLALVPYTHSSSRARALIGGSILFLLVYEVYDAVIVSMLHRSPIFSADLPHVVGAVHLLLNASLPWLHVLALLAALGGLGGLAWGLPSLIQSVHQRLRTPTLQRATMATGVAVGLLVWIGADTGQGVSRQTYRSVCYSTTECIVRNVNASLDLKRRLADRRRESADSTYVNYTAVQWTEPPSLYLVMFESYGSALLAPHSGSRTNSVIPPAADALQETDWHTASGHSRAPVFGGLSWLSAATLFLGTPVEHQPTFDVLRSRLPNYPHLVRLLQEHGYETATLQPPVRPRPGLSVGNPYDFDRTFYLEDLDYRGPSYGWGIVPDQYSLAVAHDRFVQRAERPFFLFFETVTSHAPWNEPPPPIVETPSTLNRKEPAPTTAQAGHQVDASRSRDPSQTERLSQRIRYEWRVLADYLRTEAPSNSLVVVLGDHQPYLANEESFATPVHVLSRDETLVHRFEEYGLEPGLRPSVDADTLHHAGLYSLLTRVLTVHDRNEATQTGRPLPAYHPQGVERAALLPSRP